MIRCMGNLPHEKLQRPFSLVTRWLEGSVSESTVKITEVTTEEKSEQQSGISQNFRMN